MPDTVQTIVRKGWEVFVIEPAGRTARGTAGRLPGPFDLLFRHNRRDEQSLAGGGL